MTAYTTSEKFSKLMNPTKTAGMEFEIADGNYGVAFDGDENEYERPGALELGGFVPNPTAANVYARGGSTSVVQESHTSETDEVFDVTYKNYSARAAQIANLHNLPIEWVKATTGFIQGTVGLGSQTPQLVTITGATANGLATDHLVRFSRVATYGITLYEERKVASVVATDQVRLKHPLSYTPVPGQLMERMKNFSTVRGGTEKLLLTGRAKTSCDNGDIHICHYPLWQPETPKYTTPKNDTLLMLGLTGRALAQPEIFGSSEEPVYTREYMLPKGYVA